MRFWLVLLTIGFCQISYSATAETINTPSKIEKVTVFPSGAAIVRTAKINLAKGAHEIVIGDLPGQAIATSIRVEGQATGKLLIGSVDSRRLMVRESDQGMNDIERTRLEGLLERTQDRRKKVSGDLEAAETRKQFVLNLTNLPNQPAPAGSVARAPTDWGGLLALVSSQLATVQSEILQYQTQIRDIDKEIEDIQKQLAAVAPKKVQRTEVKVNAVADVPLEGNLTIKYQVRSASWRPLYDARLATGSKTEVPTLVMTRRARITQRSGEDWNSASVVLSTTRPNAGSSAPFLPNLTVDFHVPVVPAAEVAAAPMVMDEMAQGAAEPTPSRRASRSARRKVRTKAKEVAAEVQKSPFQAVFVVPGKVDIPTTGIGKNVKLGDETLKTKLAIRTVPARDTNAYLYAEITVPKGAPILPGQVSLFRDGTFVGRNALPVLAGGEKHKLGFGIDDLVRVRHFVEANERGETGLISTASTDNRNYKITVKNLHEREIAVTVLDRIPVSRNQEIKVSLLGPTTPTQQAVDDRRGILAWERTLGPDQEDEIKFGYRVVWPAEKKIRYSK